MSDIVVSVENLGKKFCRSLQQGMMYTSADVARDMLGVGGKSAQLRRGEFWALQDISFELARGDSLGLIGHNGAGKSTLLKILNGIIRPDTGKVTMRGRIGALIEVGAGFHPMLSGRENVYVNGAILGMTRREIDRKFDQILDFSGLKPDVLDAPVKSYSSGMFVRLGFSVAVHCDPDILLIDEVLSVGDTQFIGRCRQRIAELRANGTTIILVTHSLPLMEVNCDKGICLAHGKVVRAGTSRQAASAYRSLARDEEVTDTGSTRDRFPTADIQITGVHILSDGRPVREIRSGSRATLEIDICSKRPLDRGDMYVWCVREDDELVCAVTALRVGEQIPPLTKSPLRLQFHCTLNPSTYTFGVSLDIDEVMIAESVLKAIEVVPGAMTLRETRGAIGFLPIQPC